MNTTYITDFVSQSYELNLLRDVAEVWNLAHLDRQVEVVPSHMSNEGVFGFVYAPDAETLRAFEDEVGDEIAFAEEEPMSNQNEAKVKSGLTVFDACNRIESFFGEEFTEDEILEAWQYLVDTGACWSLQGAYGRGAQALIEAGMIRA